MTAYLKSISSVVDISTEKKEHYSHKLMQLRVLLTIPYGIENKIASLLSIRQPFLVSLHEHIFDPYSIKGTLSCLFARGRERSVEKEPIKVHLSEKYSREEKRMFVFS